MAEGKERLSLKSGRREWMLCFSAQVVPAVSPHDSAPSTASRFHELAVSTPQSFSATVAT